MTILDEDQARAIIEKAEQLKLEPTQEYEEHGSVLYYTIEGTKYAIWLDHDTWVIGGEVLAG